MLVNVRENYIEYTQKADKILIIVEFSCHRLKYPHQG